MTSVAEFMSAASATVNSNTPWGARYAAELRRVVVGAAARAPRQIQTQLGPSELGVLCDWQVVGKMAGLSATNHVADPWPSIVGTAVHAWLAEAFAAENARTGTPRWVAEQRVYPNDEHPGIADLYDGFKEALTDHKVLGATTHTKIRSAGPPRKYRVQMLLYARGYRRLGLPVKRIVLAAWPRTGSSLDGLFVWEHEITAEDERLLDEVLDRTRVRKSVAELVAAGKVSMTDVPRHPEDDECYFCPFYRPESARDGGNGCPGTVITNSLQKGQFA